MPSAVRRSSLNQVLLLVNNLGGRNGAWKKRPDSGERIQGQCQDGADATTRATQISTLRTSTVLAGHYMETLKARERGGIWFSSPRVMQRDIELDRYVVRSSFS